MDKVIVFTGRKDYDLLVLSARLGSSFTASIKKALYDYANGIPPSFGGVPFAIPQEIPERKSVHLSISDETICQMLAKCKPRTTAAFIKQILRSYYASYCLSTYLVWKDMPQTNQVKKETPIKNPIVRPKAERTESPRISTIPVPVIPEPVKEPENPDIALEETPFDETMDIPATGEDSKVVAAPNPVEINTSSVPTSRPVANNPATDDAENLEILNMFMNL